MSGPFAPIQLISPELLAVACLNIPPQLLRQPRPCFQLPRQHLYKTFIAFLALRLRRGAHGVRERRVGGEPEAGEKSQRLLGPYDMIIELVERSGERRVGNEGVRSWRTWWCPLNYKKK